ncbi:unnamed protein product [Trichobilharzia regenti]|nr:unnamed protein product [Trichobilharzia regenti]
MSMLTRPDDEQGDVNQVMKRTDSEDTKSLIFFNQIKKAFYALIYNNVRAAILWDSSKQNYIGMLTITDFIKVLVTLYPPDGGKMDEFEEGSISSWRSKSEVLTLLFVSCIF